MTIYATASAFKGSGGGVGDVIGPASATDNAIARYDLTTGKLIQDSAVLIDDSGNIDTAGTINGVTTAEFGYLDATSSIQTQLDAKATGPASATDNAIASN